MDDSSSSPYVLVIGASGVDLVGRVRGPLAPGTSTPASIRSSFGGVARNVAENLGRLGQPVVLLTAVGLDANGDLMLQHASQAGVDVSHILRCETYATGSYLAVLNEQGELQFALDDMRAVNALTSHYLRQQASLFSQAAFVFVDANLPRQALRTIFSLARQVQCPVGADPTSLALAPRLAPYLSRMRLFVPNGPEAALFCQCDFNPADPTESINAAKRLVGRGVEIAIITLGEFGVCYASSQASGVIPAIRTEILDPTGAGDSLTAAVIFALLNNIPLDDAMRLGVAAASLTLRHSGAVLPSLSLETLYDQLA